MRRKTLLFLIVFVLSFIPSVVFSAPTDIINDPNQMEALIPKVKATLAKDFGIFIRIPVKCYLVKGEELDKVYSGTYRGAEVGLHQYRNGRHEIYIMKGMSEDSFEATLAHELTHAWQVERCVPEQDKVVREGFARWIEYKYLDLIGAYVLANSVKRDADPVYGVGFKKMLELEDKVGAKNMLDKVKNIVSINDIK